MALVVGNLMNDPAATSFISVADADVYLAVEGNDQWAAAAVPDKEAALVNASRWLAVSLPWCDPDLSADDLVRVGHVAARLAVQALTVDLWASGDARGNLTEETIEAGTARSTEKYDGRSRGVSAGGQSFSWVRPMLRGLLCGGGAQHDVVRR